MKKVIIVLIASAVLLSLPFFSGCEAVKKLMDKTPENFTEGIKYSKDYEDDVLEIYDDAVIFDELAAFGENVLFCGSEDDFDDIVDFYKDFFEENEISLTEEEEDRDEYYARGVFEGYEFKIKIAEPDGEYVEDLFQNVITLSTREIKNGQQLEATATPAPSAVEATPTPAPEQTEQRTETLERPPNDRYETPVAGLDAGSWVYESYLNANDPGGTVDWTIYINDLSAGTMYYADYVNGERWQQDFTYEILDGVFSIYFSNGEIWDFFAYYDYEILHLVAAYDFTKEYYLSGYVPSEQTASFTAYGDWLVYYPEDGFIGTLALWPNGTGYVYNWYSYGQDIYINWENADGVITFWDDAGDEIDSFTFIQKHNILEYTSLSGMDTYFYNRTDQNILIGYYEMTSTSEPGVDSWQLELRGGNSAYVHIQGTNTDYEDDEAYWYIDYTDGKLYIHMADQYFGFNYHHFQSGLLLEEDDDQGYYYKLMLAE